MIELTEKQERFVQGIIKGMRQAQAYRLAYDVENNKDETIWANASRLMDNNKVIARIEELRTPVAEKAQLTLSQHLKDLLDLRDKSATAEKYSAAVQAETVRGKAAGLHVEKLEVDGDLTVEIVRFGKGKDKE